MPATAQVVRVLIVDDERSIADTLNMILSRNGYDSIAVYCAVDAIKAARIFKPHALLSDVTMPGMNGFELARHFSKQFSDCKVLLMTAHYNPRILARTCPLYGLCPIPKLLRKPVPPQRILALLASCARSWRAQA